MAAGQLLIDGKVPQLSGQEVCMVVHQEINPTIHRVWFLRIETRKKRRD